MADSLKLLSWNIQKFGGSKLADKKFIEYVSLVIRKAGADVVGIMELVGWLGNEIGQELVNTLNNMEATAGTGVKWDGAASEMTPARPNEQYLFLWKTNLFSSFEWRLWNVIGETAFDSFFKTHGWNQAQQENFWKSLLSNGWLDAAFIMPYSKRETLDKNDQALDLTKKAPKITLTSKQKTEIVNVFKLETPATFPLKGSRPPFLLRLKTKATTPTDILFVLYHAPGPGNDLPIIASNQITCATPIHDTGVGVVMGDFNVAMTDIVDTKGRAKTWALQYFDFDKGRLQCVKDTTGNFIDAAPFQRLTGPAFVSASPHPELTRVENYGKRLWSDKTSTVASFPMAKNSVADAAKVLELRSSEYDKFFVRAPKPDPSAAEVIPLIDLMVPKQVQVGTTTTGAAIMEQRSQTPTPYDNDLGERAKEIYNEWWDRQNAKHDKSAATQKKLADYPKLSRAPSCLFEAYYAYREAISDHLPIVMELQYA